ncbi:MAG: CDP-glycerol glycerophosphotransferase family protein [Oscillospiraceae bacterium]|nr:CDP-glycerol glycerophosphotransferase family protein [Oscillospiraceae bacterium]
MKNRDKTNPITALLDLLRGKLISIYYIFINSVYRHLPLRNRVLFFTIRANDRLLENAKTVYDALPCKKTVYARTGQVSPKEARHIKRLLLTHKVIVTDDYLLYLRQFTLRPGQKVMQIWHAGGAFKKFGYDSDSNPNKQAAGTVSNIEQYSSVVATAEGCRKHIASGFGIPVDIVHAYGLPRTDKLFDPAYLEKTRTDFFVRHPQWKGKKIYLYAPTFREKDHKRVRYDPKLDFSEIDREMTDDEVLLIHMHPTVKYSFLDREYAHIHDVTQQEDTLVLLCVASLVITDYSTVIVEGSILRLPMMFYCPDIETYDRGFYLQYPDDLPGEMLTDGSKFIEFARKAITERSYAREEKYRIEQTAACDGHATERVVLEIMSWLSE